MTCNDYILLIEERCKAKGNVVKMKKEELEEICVYLQNLIQISVSIQIIKKVLKGEWK